MLVDEVEGRAGQRQYARPSPTPIPAGEGGFARAQVAGQADDVAGLQQRAQPHAQPPRLLGAVADDVEFAFPQNWHAAAPIIICLIIYQRTARGKP